MRSTFAFGLLTMAGFSAAQKTYTIDPNSVPQSTREYWCQMEKTQCPLICLQQPGVTTSNTVHNDCEQSDLSYSCVCDNGVSPNVTMYTQTIPYFICTEWGNQCVKACNSDNTCADKCRAENTCGASDPFKGNATASASASSSASKTATSSSNPSSTSVTAAFGGSSNSTPSGASTLSTSIAITVVGVLAGLAFL